MLRRSFRRNLGKVSLFTREWIEMGWVVADAAADLCLPLYEGVD